MLDALRGYVSMATGLAEATTETALETVRALAEQGFEVTTGAPVAVRDQVQEMADELVTTSRTNRELLVGLVRTEVDRAVGRMGFVREEELAAVRRHVQRLENQLGDDRFRARGRASDAVQGAADAARVARGVATSAAGRAATRVVATAAGVAAMAGDVVAPGDTVATPTDEAAPASAEGTPPRRSPAAKKSAAKKSAASKSAASKSAAKKSAARRRRASAPSAASARDEAPPPSSPTHNPASRTHAARDAPSAAPHVPEEQA